MRCCFPLFCGIFSVSYTHLDVYKRQLKELSTILWAATGKNREPKGWTVPMAMGREPYVSVYVLLKSGGYLYNWEKNALMQQTAEKKLTSRAVTQDFAKSAPCILCLLYTSRCV